MKQLGMIVILIMLSVISVYADAGFDTWVHGLKAEARSQGISVSLLDQAFQDVTPLPRVLQLDRHQPESTITFGQYTTRTITPTRIEQGRQRLAQHRTLLKEVGQRYGVQPRFLVALWGIETNYGQYTGEFNVIEALASLAYDGRRSSYFRKELLNALRILEEGHIALATMNGSWAGAMGQIQFMPSSFLRFAVDYDGDGEKDIWATPADMFASAANYLSQSGWRGREIWGRRATLPPGFNHAHATLNIQKPVHQWHQLGVRQANGSELPQAAIHGSIVLPGGRKGPAYLVYENFRVTMKWNRSPYFAVSVGLLADAIIQ